MRDVQLVRLIGSYLLIGILIICVNQQPQPVQAFSIVPQFIKCPPTRLTVGLMEALQADEYHSWFWSWFIGSYLAKLSDFILNFQLAVAKTATKFAMSDCFAKDREFPKWGDPHPLDEVYDDHGHHIADLNGPDYVGFAGPAEMSAYYDDNY